MTTSIAIMLAVLLQSAQYRPFQLEDTAQWSSDPLVWESGRDLPAIAIRHGDSASAIVWDGRPHLRYGVRVLTDFDRYFSDGGNGLLFDIFPRHR